MGFGREACVKTRRTAINFLSVNLTLNGVIALFLQYTQVMTKFPGKVVDGVGIFEPKNWAEIRDFLDQRLDFTPLIWRGQRRDSWGLESTLDRLLKRTNPPNPASFAKTHLENFTFACRGRRGVTPQVLSEDEWWSLGQHFGLDTPLLDWSVSPFVGLFFAFAKVTDAPSGARRVLFGLKEKMLEQRLKKTALAGSFTGASVHIVRPKTDENPRLVSQNGLFTKVPLGMDLEQLVRQVCRGEKSPYLYKILIPEGERSTILKALNRMNINYLSLFPDVHGASLFCNLRSEIPNY